jgi:hypothetical protein
MRPGIALSEFRDVLFQARKHWVSLSSRAADSPNLLLHPSFWPKHHFSPSWRSDISFKTSQSRRMVHVQSYLFFTGSAKSAAHNAGIIGLPWDWLSQYLFLVLSPPIDATKRSRNWKYLFPCITNSRRMSHVSRRASKPLPQHKLFPLTRQPW